MLDHTLPVSNLLERYPVVQLDSGERVRSVS